MINNIEDYHLVSRFCHQVQSKPDDVALSEWSEQGMQDLTWVQMAEQVNRLSLLLLEKGIQAQDRVAICGCNSIAWAVADWAILQIRAITVPIYTTNTPDQTAYVLNDAGARILLVVEDKQYQPAIALAEQCPGLEHIFVLDQLLEENITEQQLSPQLPAVQQLQQRIASRQLSDLFTLIYTSGTTGEPKGVMLDYRNIAVQLYQHELCMHLSERDVSLCFLPLAHVFERAWSFLMMHVGARNVFLRRTDKVRDALFSVQPTVMCAVPRFYEKVFSAIHEKVAQAGWGKRWLFTVALAFGRKKFLADRRGLHVGFFFSLLFRWLDRRVLSKLRATLGGNMHFLPVAGASLEDKILLFFESIGLPAKYGYGMTETCATVSCWGFGEYCLGSVGDVLPQISVRIGADNEIQLKGATLMRGYFNRPEETAQSFTDDGWFKTGDAGMLDAQGHLFVTERIKDLMKTSGGKYIAPQKIEGLLVQDGLIDQAAVIADKRQYVSALIVPNYVELKLYAEKQGINSPSIEQLLKNEQIQTLIMQRVQQCQQGLASYEQVKRVALLAVPFSFDNAQLTPTLKLRRKNITRDYQTKIDELYCD